MEIDIVGEKSQYEVDIGECWQQTQYKFEIYLSNTGSEVCEVSKVIASCGCILGASESNLIEAGRKTTNRIVFRTKGDSEFSQSLKFVFTKPQKEIVVQIRGKTLERVSVIPGIVRLNPNQDSFLIEVKPISSKDIISAVSLSSASRLFKSVEQLSNAPDNRHYRVVLSEAGKRLNSRIGESLTIALDREGVKTHSQFSLELNPPSRTRTIPAEPKFVRAIESGYRCTFVVILGDEINIGQLGADPLTVIADPNWGDFKPELRVASSAGNKFVVTAHFPESTGFRVESISELRLLLADVELLVPVHFFEEK